MVEPRGRDLERAHLQGDIYNAGPGASNWCCTTHTMGLVQEGLNLRCPKALCVLLIFSPPKVPA